MNYKETENKQKQEFMLTITEGSLNIDQDEEEEINEDIQNICNKIISNKLQDVNSSTIFRYINLLIDFPEYDIFVEKLFSKINLFDVISQFEIFIKRNPGHHLLKKINTDALLQRNDEISWNIISILLICQEISCDKVLKNIFSANISNKLYDEILDMTFLFISINEFPDKVILEIITESKSTISSSAFIKKEILYKTIKKNISSNNLFILLLDESFLALYGDIEFNIAVIIQIKNYLSNDDLFDSYFNITEFLNSLDLEDTDINETKKKFGFESHFRDNNK